MQIRVSHGKTEMTLTKRETDVLIAARDLCSVIEKHTDDCGEHMNKSALDAEQALSCLVLSLAKVNQFK